MNTYDIDISNPYFDEVLKTCIRQIRQNELFQFPYRVRRETIDLYRPRFAIYPSGWLAIYSL